MRQNRVIEPLQFLRKSTHVYRKATSDAIDGFYPVFEREVATMGIKIIYTFAIMLSGVTLMADDRGHCTIPEDDIVHEAYSCIEPKSNATLCITHVDDSWQWPPGEGEIKYSRAVQVFPADGHDALFDFSEYYKEGQSHPRRCRFIAKIFFWACTHEVIESDNKCLMAENISDNYKSGRDSKSIRLFKDSMTAEIESNHYIHGDFKLENCQALEL